MKVGMVIALGVLCCLPLNSCGGGGSSSPTGNVGTTQPASGITSGNWSIAATSTVSGAQLPMGASLVQSGNAVTGIMHFLGSNCGPFFPDDVPLTGTLTGTSLVLNSPAGTGQAIALTVTGSGNALSGSYAITGGCANGDKGTVAATFVPAISGVWNASFVSGSVTVGISATLTQAATADAHGRFPLSGTVSLTGSPCATGGTIQSLPLEPVYSTTTGPNVWVSFVSNDVDGTQGTMSFTGSVASPASPAVINGQYEVDSGLCVGDAASIQLTKQ